MLNLMSAKFTLVRLGHSKGLVVGGAAKFGGVAEYTEGLSGNSSSAEVSQSKQMEDGRSPKRSRARFHLNRLNGVLDWLDSIFLRRPTALEPQQRRSSSVVEEAGNIGMGGETISGHLNLTSLGVESLYSCVCRKVAVL